MCTVGALKDILRDILNSRYFVEISLIQEHVWPYRPKPRRILDLC